KSFPTPMLNPLGYNHTTTGTRRPDAMTPTPIYKQIARTLAAVINCQAILDDPAGTEGPRSQQAAAASDRHQARLDAILQTAPSGSGFDSGTTLDDSSTPERLKFNTAFHHMSEHGFYTGWTHHQ